MKTHIELLGWINIVSGVLWELLGLLILAIFFFLAPATGDWAGSLILSGMGLAIGGALFLLGLPTLITGIGLLKRKAWARIVALVIGILSFFNYPLGTVVAVYTFWVLTNAEAVAILEARA